MWAMVAALDTIDKRATRCIQRLELYAAVDYILAAGGFSFGWKGTVGIVLPSVFFFGGRDMFFFTILSAMLGQIFCRPIKKLTHRTRPDYSKRIPRAWNLYGKIREASSDGYSFPSGDAMSGGAVAGSLIHATGSWWWLALALYPSFGRVYWHYHYIGDVLSGAGLGLAAAAINAQIFGKRPVAGVEVTACLVLFVAFMKFTASPPPKKNAN